MVFSHLQISAHYPSLTKRYGYEITSLPVCRPLQILNQFADVRAIQYEHHPRDMGGAHQYHTLYFPRNGNNMADLRTWEVGSTLMTPNLRS